MLRRRLLSIVGAIGLVAGLISSGVAAHASTGPDSTYNALVSAFQSSSQDVCYSNGTYITPANPCVIVQATPPPGQNNVAVCVQVTSAAQECDITQTGAANNNYALVIQRINQQGTTASCPTAQPCQNGTQRASIGQTDVTGSNFGGVIQKVVQSLTEQPTDGDPGQSNQQAVRPAIVYGPGLKQTSGTGSNYAAVAQFSQQSQAGATVQSQDARQFAGYSEWGNGINQTTTAPGGNAALLGQVQKQNLQSFVATAQTENAYQDGDITQDDGTGRQNFATGNQFQDQREQGRNTTVQRQLGDPKCCSPQLAGGLFFVNQATFQFANSLVRHQTEFILGNCDSPPNGCYLNQSATVNGTTLPGDPCRAQASCHKAITCVGASCIAGPPPSTLLRFSRPNLALRGRAVAHTALLT